MSYTLANWEISVENRKAFRGCLLEAMIARAMSLAIIEDRASGNIRLLTAKDVGLKRWRTPPQEPNVSNIWIYIQVPVGQIFGFYKLIQLSKKPTVTTISYSLGVSGATILANHDFEHLYSMLPVLEKLWEHKSEKDIQSLFGGVDQMVMEAYFTEPILYLPQDYIRIGVKAPEGNKRGDKLMLGGFVLERIGDMIG